MLRVFILEDNEYRLNDMKKTFTGHMIDIARSCTEVDQFKPPYDLIIMDHDLGNRKMSTHEDNGANFLEKIKDRINPDAILIFDSMNHYGSKKMYDIMKGRGFRAPFGWADFNNLVSKAKYWDEQDNKKVTGAEDKTDDKQTQDWEWEGGYCG